MIENSSTYAPYKAKQMKLENLLKESSKVVSILNMNYQKDTLKSLGDKVHNDNFKIQVVGTFKNGKSTFINSFLGNDILPAYSTPTTAVINEVKYGKEKKAVLYFKNPLPDQMPSGIPDKAIHHMRKYNMKSIPPLEISYDEIEDYAVIPIGKDPKEMLMESPYDKIELFWPLDLLQNSVEIIDSPGLNEHATRTQVTMEYLSKADAVLFVLTANQLCSEEEMKFIENSLRKKGFEDIYFLVNRFDSIVFEKDKMRTKEYAKLKLSNQTNFGESGIFFISALNALRGKTENNVELYKNSGMEDFEKTLANFLVHQKGKIKLSQPARELKRILDKEALYNVIPQQKSMLENSLDDLKKKYEKAKPQLKDLAIKRDQLEKRINLLIDQMMPEIRRYIQKYFADLNTNLPVWVQQYEPKTSISMFKIKESSEELVTELSEFLKDKIEEEQGLFMENTLQPIISDKVQNMLTSIEGTLESFFVELDSIKVNITGINAEVKDVPLWQRIAAAGGGFLIGGIGGAAMGGVGGFTKEFAKGIGLEIGAYLGLYLFGLLNPITIIAVVAACVIRAVIKNGSALTSKVKDKVIEETLSQINSSANESTEKMVEDIKIKISAIGKTVVDSMNNEINAVQFQVDDIIRRMKLGQNEVDKRKAEIIACEEKIKGLSMDLDNFIFQLIS